MGYQLVFHRAALKEWHKLGDTVRQQFKKKLSERLENPHVIADKLRNSPNRYKIKLRSAGYRLVYEVSDKQITVTVIAVGKRNDLAVYTTAEQRH